MDEFTYWVSSTMWSSSRSWSQLVLYMSSLRGEEMCSPFSKGFIPGVAVGIVTSLLLLYVWTEHPLLGPITNPPFNGVLLRRTTLQLRIRGDGGDREAKYNDICGVQHLQSIPPPPPPPSSYLLLVLVHSKADEWKLREVIRTTWLDGSDSEYVTRFVIGTLGLDTLHMQQLACENQEYGDLLLLPTVGNSGAYSSSEKALQALLWTVNTHLHFSYIFKCTSTTYARMPVILKELGERRSKQGLIWGFFMGSVEARRSGFRGEKAWHLCDSYLPFPGGSGYILSWDLVELIALMSEDLEPFEHEDIALGVWLAPFSDIERRHDVRFDTALYSRGCNNSYIVTGQESALSMKEKHSLQMTTGKICSQEFQTRLSYIYNWNVPPDMCCIKTLGIP